MDKENKERRKRPHFEDIRFSDVPWDPLGYCWTHGYKVRLGHNSYGCKTKALGHKDEATRGNTMGGSDHNKGWHPDA